MLGRQNSWVLAGMVLFVLVPKCEGVSAHPLAS